jgi:hypothetical protein
MSEALIAELKKQLRTRDDQLLAVAEDAAKAKSLILKQRDKIEALEILIRKLETELRKNA